MIASSIVTDEKFNKTLKTSARIQRFKHFSKKKLARLVNLSMQAHTGIVYFVIHHVFFVYLCCISWDVFFSNFSCHPYVINIQLRNTIDIYLSGLLARRQNAWSQDGGNMRVIANGVNR